MPRNRNRRRSRNLINYTPVLASISETVSVDGEATSSAVIPLVTNESDAFSNLTVKNFTTNLLVEIPNNTTGSTVLDQVGYYIMFVPEGYVPAVNLPFIHPEWILNYSYVGTPLPDSEPVGFNIRKVSRRIRKLKPGDTIALFVLATNSTSNPINLNINGLIKFLSKRN